MFYYFGFGSNMNLTSLRAKGVEPLSAQRAVLPGWRLCFNVQHFFRNEGGVGNIERMDDPEASVQGVVYKCSDEYLAPLDAAEAYGHGYDRILVSVELGSTGDRNGQTVSAFTYVGMPDFIDDSCLPSQRYINLLVAGANDAGLDKNYINTLKTHPIHQVEDYPKFVPPNGTFPEFDLQSLSDEPLFTALAGHVFNMAKARPLHEYLKSFFGGKDMTLFHLKRMDSSTGDESIELISSGLLNKSQRDYLNNYLNEYSREYEYIGRFVYC